MELVLTIENETSLPDGGPLSVTVTGKRGIDIGRYTHLDWTLPDPTRFISGKHCEIRWKDGSYWLFDVSTNGTFLYGAQGRLKGPHQLRTGDRLVIGHYTVAVHVAGEVEAAAPGLPAAEHSSYDDLWNATADTAPPVDRSMVQAPRQSARAVHSDFLDWAVDVPQEIGRDPPRARTPEPPREQVPSSHAAPPPLPEFPRAFEDDQGWAKGTEKPEPVLEPPPPVPNPRRPVYVSTEPGGPWGAPGDGSPVEEPAPGPAELPPAAPFAPPPASRVPPPAAPARAPVAPSALDAGAPPPPAYAGNLLARFAHGANIPEQVFERQNPEQVAEQLGMLMRLVVENLRQLLNARLEAKRLARSANQTMVQALDNNPLKFSPTAEDAMRIMFGPPTRSYLDAPRALQQSFDDIKTHQLKTYTAMQQALGMLISEFDPKTIEQETDADRGLAAVVGSRKARLWDAYVARWQAQTRRHDDGLVDVFMQYFAECYDRGGNTIR
jgi:type VI secretion system protein ImpI